MRSLIDMAADRGAYIDQSQSLNLFVENPTIGAVSSMYFYAWKKGLKTTYYLRSRPKTRITKTTVEATGDAPSATATLTIPTASNKTYVGLVKGDSPVGYWRLGELEGEFAKDEIGSNDGTYLNGVTLGGLHVLNFRKVLCRRDRSRDVEAQMTGIRHSEFADAVERRDEASAVHLENLRH